MGFVRVDVGDPALDRVAAGSKIEGVTVYDLHECADVGEKKGGREKNEEKVSHRVFLVALPIQDSVVSASIFVSHIAGFSEQCFRFMKVLPDALAVGV